MICRTLQLGALQTCCYLYSSDDVHLHIIDPGGDFELIGSFVEQQELVPVSIILTHAHFDHVAGCGDLVRAYPDLEVFASEYESRLMGTSGAALQMEFLQRLPQISGLYQQQMRELPEVTTIIREGSVVGESGLQVLEVPGHTRGSLAFYNETAGILFSGDALFHESIGRTDLPGGSKSQLISSIVEKLFSLPDQTQVLPGHGRQTTIAHEKQFNPFLRKGSVL
jgi:glyoxylase-like metal-dependent hydrolase (beta-lactamase superfamily II)